MMEVTTQVYVVVMVTLVGMGREENTAQATKLREEPLQSVQLLYCLFDDVGIPKYYLV